MIENALIGILTIILLGATVLQALRLRRLYWTSQRIEPMIPGPDDTPTMIIRKIDLVPRLERSEKVIYRPGDYAQKNVCIDPSCDSPRIAPGQVVERIQTSHNFLFVCLDCIDRSQQHFAQAME